MATLQGWVHEKSRKYVVGCVKTREIKGMIWENSREYRLWYGKRDESMPRVCEVARLSVGYKKKVKRLRLGYSVVKEKMTMMPGWICGKVVRVQCRVQEKWR